MIYIEIVDKLVILNQNKIQIANIYTLEIEE